MTLRPHGVALSAALYLAMTPALAVDVLYRGDDRPPETIFRDGFQARGTNFNAFDHLSGRSCSPHTQASQRSAYVALTASHDNAMWFGRYVYRVVPDADAMDHGMAVDATAGLRDLYDNGAPYGLDLRQRTIARRLQSFWATAEQYIAMDIPGWQIRSAEEYRIDPATRIRTLVRRVDNPAFRAPARTGTRTRFSVATIAAIRDLTPPPTLTYAVARNGTTATACQLPPDDGGACGGSAQSRTSTSPRESADDWQCVVEPALEANSPFNQAVQLLLQ